MIVEIELPPETARTLDALVQDASGEHPEIRAQLRSRLVAEALAHWLPEAAVVADERLRLNRERVRSW